jgi:serine/threonine-protein kinase HipA
MSTLAEVRLWGKTIGAVSLQDGEEVASFEYDAAFAQSGIQVAPVVMPLSRRVYRFPELSRPTFHGLPGLLADSLPDKFGNALIDAWLASQGRQPGSFNAVERLCYTGERGMGALEFAPAIGPRAKLTTPIEVGKLVELASEVLAHRNNLQASFAAEGREDALRDILRVGTSAGGARAKAIIAWNPKTNEVRSGQVKAGKGFEYWLLKFDGVSGNKDKELEDPKGYGMIEYAYYLMALDCGIEISECRLFKENGRSHFMTRRFDRLATGEKLHMQSLCALAHYDFNMAGAYSYEQALLVMRQLQLPMQAIEQLFRRMAFNIVARDTIKVGVLHSLSGTMAISETALKDVADDHRRASTSQGRRAGQEARAGGGRPGLQLAAVRREGAPAADQGQGGRDLRLLDLGVAQVGAAGVQGTQRPAVLPGAVRG